MLHEGDRSRLEALTRSSSVRAGLASRARIVLLAADGLPNAEIARRTGTSRPTVVGWRARYDGGGIRALHDQQRSGRPPEIDEIVVVVATLADDGRPPAHLGVTHWSARLLAAELKIGFALADGPGDLDVAQVAVAVVTGPAAVLAGRRRDGIPRWVFPGGRIHDGETPADAAVRECAEETGLSVTAGKVIGQRTHPATGQHIAYVACTPTDGTAARVAAPDELAEVRWLGLDKVDDLMPDLFGPVREHLAECSAGQ